MALAFIEVHRLTPQDADAARTAGEERALAQMVAADEAARAKRRAQTILGFGLGTGITPQGYAPLGDVGQNGFVFTPGSIGARRFRD
ncbi:hypothetical protein [Glacieibacterium frigidum]|uniref:Uncharacterized protein n=1 Tax=Glacieibacterium frigidum TaxID=2593303 RepID=A0A552U9Y3_9SPHN|nr:hypothetical protein [Glacieibacterium frigidum]TRW15034.1 hypothetical protein FMM06_15390 [Glacieibacterium frigidum]